MTYQDIYDLVVVLPYPVYDKKGGAKYDKATKTLTVTLPVKPPALSEVVVASPIAVQSESATEDDSDMADMDRGALAAVSTEAPHSSSPSTSLSSSVKKGQQHSRWVGGTIDEEAKLRAEELKKEIQIQAEAEKVKWAEQEAAQTSKDCQISKDSRDAQKDASLDKKKAKTGEALSPSSSSASPSLPSSRPVAGAEGEEFIPCARFAGSKKGYYFTKGPAGLGYYLDPKQQQRKKKVAFAAAEVDSVTPVSTSTTSASESLSAAGTATSSSRTPTSSAETSTMTSPPSSTAQLASSILPTVSYSNFKFEFRETGVAVPLLVQVPYILHATVRITYHPHRVDICFKSAPPDQEGSDSSTSSSSSSSSEYKVDSTSAAAATARTAVTVYGMSFSLVGEIDGAQCTFDVASKNMVVVLTKRVAGAWAEGSAKVTGGAYAGPGYEQTLLQATGGDAQGEAIATLGAAGGARASDSTDSERSSPTVKTQQYTSQIQEMRFQNETLFDLD